MTYHVVCQVGDAPYLPRCEEEDHIYRIAFDRADDRQSVGSNIGRECRDHGLVMQARANDLLRFAVSVYCADTGIRRATAYDDWTRDLHLHVPVAETEAWNRSRQTIENLLNFLTGDHWRISIRQLEASDGLNSGSTDAPKRNPPDAVALFSGGLDSFIGAVDLLSRDRSVALVGHHGAGTTNRAQRAVHEALVTEYGDQAELLPFYLQPPPPLGERGPEKSTRSRSLLFLAMGTAVAMGFERTPPFVVPENGLISLNPSLTDSRSGSLSTRTTHPHTIDLYRRFLQQIGIDVRIELPYRFATKSEMVKKTSDPPVLESNALKTVSCSHPDVGRFAGRSPGENCGYCFPCIIRRAALWRAGLDDPSHYQVDILKSPPPASSDKGSDLRALAIALERFGTKPRSRLLFDVLDTGPIPPEEIRKYVDVYERGMSEIVEFCTEAEG